MLSLSNAEIKNYGEIKEIIILLILTLNIIISFIGSKRLKAGGPGRAARLPTPGSACFTKFNEDVMTIRQSSSRINIQNK